jgi:kynurenine formamidase
MATHERRAAKNVPSYADLLVRTDAPRGSSWNLFGDADELGSVNFMTEESITRAAALVERGRIFNLEYPINGFDPPLFAERPHAAQTIFGRHADQRDDYLDGYYLQSTSHIDGLRHRRHSEHGFYNGVADEEVAVGTPALGVQRWSETGIVGRGVLLDVDRYRRACGRPIDHEGGEPLDVELLDEVAEAQGVTFESGDILLIRTGWCHYFFHEASDAALASLRKQMRSTGLIQSHDTLAWLWDHQFALVAADNVALETLPVSDSSPFASETDGGLMHQQLIALLGLVVGELWALDELADDSMETGRYDSFVVAKPLNLVGGVGGPANALAIR